MTHRLTYATRTAFVAIAALVMSLLTVFVPAGAASGGPVVETAPTRTPDGYAHAGRSYVGNIGTWSGTGTLSYVLEWRMCSPHDANQCRSVASKTTTDPSDTLSYTPTEADNFSEWYLSYEVTAHDSTGDSSWEQFVGPILPTKTWYEPAGSGFKLDGSRGAIDDTGVATLVGSASVGAVSGLYAQRLVMGQPAGGFELVYGTSRPENDPTAVLAVEVDDSERVHVVFLDDKRNLMVTDRDPATGSWAEPARLAAAGTFHLNTFRDTDGRSLLVAAGTGRAAAAWLSAADPDDPSEMHIATRGVSGWASASVHVADQPKFIDCGPDYTPVTIGDATDAEIGIDDTGDVTVLWTRSEQTCPGDPYQGYNRLEAVFRRDGAWTPVTQLNRMPGFFGNYVPVAMETSRAGTAVALTRGWFEGDSSNTRDNLYLLTAGAGSTFSALDPESGAPATVLRRWAANGDVADDGQLTMPDGVDIALSDNGKLHVAWAASGTGVPHTIEVASGTLSEVAPAEIVASRTADLGTVREPTVTVSEGGAAAIAFAGTVRGDHSMLSYFALHDPQNGWGVPQTIGAMTSGVLTRWFPGADAVLRYDDGGRLIKLRNASYGSSLAAALTRLAAGSGPPTVEIGGPSQVKAGSTATLEPLVDVDPDGGSLSYAWDLDFDGAYDDGASRQVAKAYSSPGRYWVGLRVTAEDGDFDIAKRFVDVVANSAPTIYGLSPEGTPTAGSPATYKAEAGDDFDESSQLAFVWSFDGKVAAGQTGSTAAHTFSSGWHTVSVKVTDSDGASSTLDRAVFVEGVDPATHTLDVTKTGGGTGRVDGPGISCGTDCDGTYPEGTEVTLVADPAEDSVFSGWSGCTEEVDGDCVVVMDDDVDVTAGFDIASSQERTLTVAVNGAGSGTVTGPGVDCGGDCTAIGQQGDQIVLTAVPGASSKLKGWSGCDSVVDGGQGCAVTLSDDKSVSAKFVPRFDSIDTVLTSTKVNHPKRKATIAFEGSSPAGVDHFECKLDVGSWARCTTPAVLRKLGRGSHTFMVRTVDSDGITDKTPAEVTFKVKRR